MALTILPSTSHTFSAAGGSWSIEVYHQGQDPEVTPSDTWMTVTWRGFSDNGSFYEIQVPAYSDINDRTGTIDFEHFQGDSATVTITQQGTAQGTIYTNPSVLVWDNQGGQRTFLVAGTAALSGQSLNNGMYTAASWIPSISYSGAGGGGYFYTVTAASHQPDPPADIYREDTVDIDGDGGVTTVLDIVQGEIITAENQMDINGLGTYTGAAFGVYFKDAVSVSKEAGDDWYNVSVRTSGSRYNIYNVSASQNNTGQTRTGTATFTDKYSSVSIPVVQTPLGTVSFDKPGLSFSSSGGTENVNITYTQTGASYWISDSWATLSEVSNDPVNKTITVAVTAGNNLGQDRLTTLWAQPTDGVSSVSIPVVQRGSAVVQTTVNPSSLVFGPATSTLSTSVSYSGILSYSIPPGEDWVSVSTSQVTSGQADAYITAATNPSVSSRHLNVTFTGSSSGDATLALTQTGMADLSVNPSSITFGSLSSSSTIKVSNYLGSVSTSKSGDWITIGSPTGTYTKTYPISVASNSGADRTGWVSFTDERNITKGVSIEQSTGFPVFTVSVSSVSLSYRGEIVSFNVTYPQGTPNYYYQDLSTINTSGDFYFCGNKRYSYSSSEIVSVTYDVIAGHNTGSTKTGLITVIDSNNITKTINVSQAAGHNLATMNVSKFRIDFGLNSSFDYVDVEFTGNPQSFTYYATYLNNYASNSFPGYVVEGFPIRPGNKSKIQIGHPGTRERESAIGGLLQFSTDTESFNILCTQPKGTPTISDIVSTPTQTIYYVPGSGPDYSYIGFIHSTSRLDSAPTVSVTYLTGDTGWVSSNSGWVSNNHFPTNPNYDIYHILTRNGGVSQVSTARLDFVSGNTTTSIIITYKPNSGTMTLDPEYIHYSGSGGTESVRVIWTDGDTPLTTISYPAGGPQDWILAHSAGPGGSDYYDTEYTVGANTSTSRTASVIYDNGVETIALPITQDGGSAPAPVLSILPPKTFDFNSLGGLHQDLLNISYNQTNYTVSFPDKPDWVELTVKDYTSTGVEYYVETYRNVSEARSATITAVGSIGGSDTFKVNQGGTAYPALSVNTNNLSFTSASGRQNVTVTNISGALSYTPTPSGSWISVSESGSGSSRTLSVGVSQNDTSSSRSGSLAISDSRQNPVSVAISQAAGQAPIDTITFSDNTMSFNAVDTTQKILTVTHPDGWLNFDKNYQQGSGWLTVTLREYIDNNTTSYNVYITDGYDNTGNSRQCYLDFTSYSGATGRVVVTQQAGAAPPPASGDYIPVWRDFLYSPSGFRNGQDYAYSLRGSGGTVLYQGVTVAPDSSHTPDPINITRLVESYVNSGDFNYTSGSWKKLPGELTVNFYKVGQSGLIQQWLIWNDWSRYKLVYDSISTLNDPINFRACQGMKLPLCVYQKGTTSWSMTEAKKNGTSSTTSFSYPSSYKFAIYVPSYTSSAKRLDFKRGGTTQFSYDMTACGQGYFLYRNRFGGWDSFLIEGNIYKKEGYARQNYTSPVNTSYGYSVDRHTDRTNITTSYEVHTGWLTDQEAERLVYHLLSSPKVYFTSFEGDHYELGDMKEVILTGSQAEYKKYRNGRKLTSYTITFDAADTKRVQR